MSEQKTSKVYGKFKGFPVIPLWHSKRLGRELAMQFLFQCDLAGTDNFADSMKNFWDQAEHSGEFPDEHTFRRARAYAEKLIAGVYEHEEDLNKIINEFSDKWDITRMPVVDRNVIRVAMAEMFYFPDIPVVVSINEAVEIVKDYSTEKSCTFINGLLNAVKVKVPPHSKIPVAKKHRSKKEEE